MTTIGMGGRNRIFKSLCAAKDSLQEDHTAHAHLAAIAKEVGGSFAGSDSGRSTDYSSPGTIDRNPDVSTNQPPKDNRPWYRNSASQPTSASWHYSQPIM